MEVRFSDVKELEFVVDNKPFRLVLPIGCSKESSLQTLEMFKEAIENYFAELARVAEEQKKAEEEAKEEEVKEDE